MQEVITLVTAPASEPVSLADAKAWLRVDITDDDALITGLIPAARMVCEAICKKSFVNRQYMWTFDYFPNRLVVQPATVVWDSWLNARLYPYTQAQVLTPPKTPLVSIDLIQYYDLTGTLQTLSSAAYTVETGTMGRVSPTPGTQWPATQDRIGCVLITFTAGEGASSANVDANVITAINMLVAHWYRNREAVMTGSATEVPLGVKSLLGPSRSGWYG